MACGLFERQIYDTYNGASRQIQGADSRKDIGTDWLATAGSLFCGNSGDSSRNQGTPAFELHIPKARKSEFGVFRDREQSQDKSYVRKIRNKLFESRRF